MLVAARLPEVAATSMPSAFGWLQDALVSVLNVAHAGPAIRTDGERYASTSTHLAMLLYDLLQNEDGTPFKELEQSVLAIGGTAKEAAAGLKRLVRGVSVFLDVKYFHAPNGLYDIPQILATSYFARKGSAKFNAGKGSMYQTYLFRMQWLLLMANVISIKKEGAVLSTKDLEQAIEKAAPGNFEMSNGFIVASRKAGRHLVPTPAAFLAARGCNRTGTQTDGQHFVEYVRGVNRAVVEEMVAYDSNDKLCPEAQYFAHVRLFLSGASERLALAVLPCDRAPIIAPWYASMMTSVRIYAHTLATVVGGTHLSEPSVFAAWSLMAMANSDFTDNINTPSAAELLFNAPTKSMYSKMPEQDGPWWVLLRATLSGMSVEQAHMTARILIKAAVDAPEIVRTVGFFCVMMHTQTGMAIAGYKQDGRYPIMDLIACYKDPVCGQSALELIMNTLTGSSDLSSLASDDLAFTDCKRNEFAWVSEVSVRFGQLADSPPSSVLHDDDVVAPIHDAFKNLAFAWMLIISGRSAPATGNLSAFEMEAALMRVSVSQASIHNAHWLAMAFSIACELEKWMQLTLREPALIRSPLASRDTVIDNLVLDVHKTEDDAALRSHFCMQGEHALTGARKGGMWRGNHHLILATWLCVDRGGKSGPGVSVFARAITPHTIDVTEIQASAVRLITDEWKREVKRRGDDSVVECAREFERALHARNIGEIAAASASGEVAIMPVLPRRSCWRKRAAALASGSDFLNPAVVPDLDEATGVTLRRLRAAQADVSNHANILYARTTFCDGCCVAVVGLPVTEEDMSRARSRPARARKKPAFSWSLDRTALLKRIAMFE